MLIVPESLPSQSLKSVLAAADFAEDVGSRAKLVLFDFLKSKPDKECCKITMSTREFYQ